jgi:hypothetical protein
MMPVGNSNGVAVPARHEMPVRPWNPSAARSTHNPIRQYPKEPSAVAANSASRSVPSATYRNPTSMGCDRHVVTASTVSSKPVAVVTLRLPRMDSGTVRHHLSRTAK